MAHTFVFSNFAFSSSGKPCACFCILFVIFSAFFTKKKGGLAEMFPLGRRYPSDPPTFLYLFILFGYFVFKLYSIFCGQCQWSRTDHFWDETNCSQGVLTKLINVSLMTRTTSRSRWAATCSPRFTFVGHGQFHLLVVYIGIYLLSCDS